MLTTTTTDPADVQGRRAPTWIRRPAVRWLVTFAGFPLGAVLARAIAGPIDSTAAALVGGAVNGAVIGAVQGWALRPAGIAALRWVAATTIGLALGLAVGVTVVDFSTTTGALALQGLICGLAVGLGQAIVLVRHLGRFAAAWPILLGGLWSAGWTIAASIGVDVDEQFTVFGSSGAVTVTVLTAVLPLALAHRQVRS